MAYFVFFICAWLALLPGTVWAQDQPVETQPLVENQTAEVDAEADNVPEAPAAEVEQDTESARKTRVGPRPYVPRPELPDSQQARLQALADSSDTEDVQWLQTPYGKFLALYKREYTGDPKGGVILLHNPGQHADWPSSIAKLRQQLPEVGWASLAISLPDIPAPVLPKRTLAVRAVPADSADEEDEQPSSDDEVDVDTASAEPDNSSAEDQTEALSDPGAPPAEVPFNDLVAIDPEQAFALEPAEPTKANGPAIDALVTARLNTAISYMQQQGLYNLVLIGEGVAASWMVAYANSYQPAAGDDPQDQQTTSSVQGVILINAQEAPGALAFDSAPLMASLRLPIFDLLVSQQEQLKHLAKRRLYHARRAHHQRYKQLQLKPFATVSKSQDSLLVRRVRGWLKTQVQGQEVDSYKAESS